MPHNEYILERDSSFISGFGRATRLVTVHDLGPSSVRGEWYVLIDGRTPLFGMGKLEADIHESGINHRKLTHLIKNEADILISSLLDEQMSKNNASVAINYQHHWETIGEAEMIELWLPGRHKAAFEQIIDSTQCDPLKSILLDVMQYTPLTNRSGSASPS